MCMYGIVRLLMWCLSAVGVPEEQDDSENSTIYITGLTENATLDEVADFFKHSGIIRVRTSVVAVFKIFSGGVLTQSNPISP